MSAETSGVQPTLRVRTRVLPGHRIELIAPEFEEGDELDVFLVPSPPAVRESIFDIIASLKGHRLFQSSEEVDRYIHEERDSWDR